MIRAIVFLVLLIGLAAGVVWVADNPGTVRVQWLGAEYFLPVWLTAAAVLLFSAASSAVIGLIGYLKRGPRKIMEAWRARRRRQGYEALTKGMVAAAAGDAQEAKRHSRRAEALLNDPPLTLLLSAQTAQLGGDEKAAETFFKAMAGRPDMEFLGLRGLLTQALKRGDPDTAMEIAKRAHALRPGSEWVADALFRLQSEAGRWIEAGVVNDGQARHKLIGQDAARRRRAVTAFEASRTARKAGDAAGELAGLKQAHDLAPGLAPATARYAERLIADGRTRKVRQLLEKAWPEQPHPSLVEPYMSAAGAADAPARYRAAQKLSSGAGEHVESALAVAAEAVKARFWGDARARLAPILAPGGMDAARAGALGRAARLMAQVEEAQRQDLGAARELLLRASMADPDPAWVCGACGAATEDWSAICGQCRAFDTLTWKTAARLERLAGGGGTAPVPAGGKAPVVPGGVGSALSVTPPPPDIPPPDIPAPETSAERAAPPPPDASRPGVR